MIQEQLEITNFLKMLESPWFLAIFLILSIWSLVWKGIALWRAAKNKSLAWYIILLCVNTVGILEIIYIFFFSKPKVNQQ